MSMVFLQRALQTMLHIKQNVLSIPGFITCYSTNILTDLYLDVGGEIFSFLSSDCFPKTWLKHALSMLKWDSRALPPTPCCSFAPKEMQALRQDAQQTHQSGTCWGTRYWAPWMHLLVGSAEYCLHFRDWWYPYVSCNVFSFCKMGEIRIPCFVYSGV